MIQLKKLGFLLVLAALAAIGCGQSLVEFPLDPAPTVILTSPVNGASDIDVDTQVSATFSRAMDPATLTAETFTLTQGSDAVPATVAYADGTAVLTPLATLAAGGAFTATITTGATDAEGLALSADYVWGFSTRPVVIPPDTTPPVIVSTLPDNGAVGAPVDTLVQVEFDEAMDPGTITDATFEVTQGAVAVAGSVTYAGVTATFIPSADFEVGVPFTATITAAVTDVAGNALAADYTWTFTTGTPPVVTVTNPANGAFYVALDRQVDATFNVVMDPTTITPASFTVRQGPNPVAGTVSYAGTTATFKPTNDYDVNSILTATLTTAVKDAAGNALLNDYVWTFQTGSLVGQGSIDLGSASSFAILAFNTVTNVNNPGTIVTGDLGISPGAALVGFPPGEIIGATHAGDATAAAAKVDLLTAYNEAAGRLGAAVLPGDLSGLTFYPGLYKNSTSVMISAGDFTINALGDVNAVFIFQMGSTFTMSPGTQILLSGGAKARNVYWSVGTSATLGTNTIVVGNILAGSAITMDTGASIEGRLLAMGAAVALDTNAVTLPSP